MMKLRFVRKFQTVTILIVKHRNLNTAPTPKCLSDDIETHFKSLEDKLLSKIPALKSHFFNDIFHLRNDITLLKENNEKAKPAIQIIRKTKY